VLLLILLVHLSSFRVFGCVLAFTMFYRVYALRTGPPNSTPTHSIFLAEILVVPAPKPYEEAL